MVDALSLALGATLGVAAGFALARAIYRPRRGFASAPAQGRLACTACTGETFRSVDAARDHAIGEHTAIDATNWDAVITEV